MNNDQKPAEPIEKKHLADEATGKKEPSANPERPPQHQPGFEAKQQAEAEKAKPKGEKADEDHDKPKPRAHTARAKVHVRTAKPKAKVRKHK